MQYGQIVFLLFVAMVFYYAAMIFMDFQRAKAAQNAGQDSNKEEDIDISEEARSFRPIRINRDEPESKEQSSEQSNTENPESNNESNNSAIIIGFICFTFVYNHYYYTNIRKYFDNQEFNNKKSQEINYEFQLYNITVYPKFLL